MDTNNLAIAYAMKKRAQKKMPEVSSEEVSSEEVSPKEDSDIVARILAKLNKKDDEQQPADSESNDFETVEDVHPEESKEEERDIVDRIMKNRKRV